jgi:hypothetical protein
MNWLDTLKGSERRIYSQCGEEGILERIFENIGTTNRFLVDVGAGDGVTLSNTRMFLDQGWDGNRFDVKRGERVHSERVTAENICGLLEKHGTPKSIDLMSLDIDGIDWWVLRSILRGGYMPRVLVCEINNSKPTCPPVTVEYDPGLVFANSDYFGASLGAFTVLAEAHCYALVHCIAWNAFFVRRGLLPTEIPEVQWSPKATWPPDPQQRPWHEVTKADVP